MKGNYREGSTRLLCVNEKQPLKLRRDISIIQSRLPLSADKMIKLKPMREVKKTASAWHLLVRHNQEMKGYVEIVSKSGLWGGVVDYSKAMIFRQTTTLLLEKCTADVQTGTFHFLDDRKKGLFSNQGFQPAASMKNANSCSFKTAYCSPPTSDDTGYSRKTAPSKVAIIQRGTPYGDSDY